MGLQQKSSQMKSQHFKYFEYARINLENLASEYPDVPLLQQQSEYMNNHRNKMNVIDNHTFCADPIKFLLPPV